MSKVASKLNKKIAAARKGKNLKIKMKAKPKTKKMAKPKAKISKKIATVSEKKNIVIDQAQGLIFENEKTLFGYFSEQIKFVEEKYNKNYHVAADFSIEEVDAREMYLEATLDDPDEIWVDRETFKDMALFTLIKYIDDAEEPFFYVAVVYLDSDEKQPTFIFLHYATKDNELAESFREKEIIYHRKLESIQFAALPGDSLLEGDYLAIGLLESMMILRNEKDISPDQFHSFVEYRDQTINQPDEIWRKVDSEGHTLVTFIKDISEDTKSDYHYIVVTEEDPNSQVHSLLFSFPTSDVTLVDRYRQGENLEAEEVTTENSH